MKKGKHTQGPWSKHELDVNTVTLGPGRRCVVYHDTHPDDVADVDVMEALEADANLISASPDLYAVAKMIERIPMSVPRHVVEAARAAIAKADGKGVGK